MSDYLSPENFVSGFGKTAGNYLPPEFLEFLRAELLRCGKALRTVAPALEHENADLKKRLDRCDTVASTAMREATTFRNQVEYLVRTIRDMDQEIYNMGQKDSWTTQRPHFARLYDEMTARKVAESKRIGDLLRPELIETYTAPQQKRLK